jgi:hypothetical protein
VRIDVRLPWQGFSMPKKWDMAAAFFAVLIVALVLSISLPLRNYLPPLLPQDLASNTFFMDVVLPVTITLIFMGMVFFASGFPLDPSWSRYFSVAGFAYLFLAFAGFFNIYFKEFVYQGQYLLPWTVAMIGLGGMIPKEWITPDINMLKVFIPLATLLGCITSLFVLKHMSEKYSIPAPLRRAQKAIILTTTLLYLFIL